jgi:hypothetical protein
MAIPSSSDFDNRFPEFAGRPDTLMTSVLAAAASRTPASRWGPRQFEAVLYLAADMMARSPYAREMKLVQKDDSTLYSKTLRSLKVANMLGVR